MQRHKRIDQVPFIEHRVSHSLTDGPLSPTRRHFPCFHAMQTQEDNFFPPVQTSTQTNTVRRMKCTGQAGMKLRTGRHRSLVHVVPSVEKHAVDTESYRTTDEGVLIHCDVCGREDPIPAPEHEKMIRVQS